MQEVSKCGFEYEYSRLLERVMNEINKAANDGLFYCKLSKELCNDRLFVNYTSINVVGTSTEGFYLEEYLTMLGYKVEIVGVMESSGPFWSRTYTPLHYYSICWGA